MKTKLILSFISASFSITLCFVAVIQFSILYLIPAGALALTVFGLSYNICRIIMINLKTNLKQ